MSAKSNTEEENLVPVEGYTEDVKNDGSKVFSCKQCEKEIKTEQGVKMHITTKHKKQSKKRTCPKENDASGVHDDNKKTKFGSVLEDPDETEFEFDSVNMETSSQIGGTDHLDNTSDICADYLRGKPEKLSEFDDLDNTANQIVRARATTESRDEDNDLINLDETLSHDQDHNYLAEDDVIQDGDNDIELLRAKNISPAPCRSKSQRQPYK